MTQTGKQRSAGRPVSVLSCSCIARGLNLPTVAEPGRAVAAAVGKLAARAAEASLEGAARGPIRGAVQGPAGGEAVGEAAEGPAKGPAKGPAEGPTGGCRTAADADGLMASDFEATVPGMLPGTSSSSCSKHTSSATAPDVAVHIQPANTKQMERTIAASINPMYVTSDVTGIREKVHACRFS